MTYVISDLHGRADKYNAMLDKIAFSDDDTLYVLGDVIDRNYGGVSILLDMADRPNVVPILGNHELLALPTLRRLALDLSGVSPPQKLYIIENTPEYRLWMENGGAATVMEFRPTAPDEKRRIVEYISDFRAYAEIEVCGRRYHLSHTLPPFDPATPIHDVTLRDFVWGEPTYETRYDPDMTFVTGHTPTALIDRQSTGRIWRGNGHIAIDCGAGFGSRLGCICLENEWEFYV